LPIRKAQTARSTKDMKHDGRGRVARNVNAAGAFLLKMENWEKGEEKALKSVRTAQVHLRNIRSKSGKTRPGIKAQSPNRETAVEPY